LFAATGAQAQTTWTCEEFPDVLTLGTKLQTLSPDVQLSAKVVVRQFQSLTELKAAAAGDQISIEASAPGAKVPIPGAKLGHMIFIDNYKLLLEDSSDAVEYNPFTSPGDVANALNDLPAGEADDAKVVVEQFTAQLKHQKHTPVGQLRLLNQYIMFYLAPFSEAQTNSCGTVTVPSPTPTSTTASTPTTTPTAVSTTMGGGTPTPTALATLTTTATPGSSPQQTPTATPTQAAAPTPTTPCVGFGGQACGSATPTPFFSSPTPTASCVGFGGQPCPSSSPTPSFAMPTPTQSCVQFGGQPCPTPTPAS
jgi:hypothetical protein